tara:strand:+ start:491 stop:718 length:228 start_codon:yes stop_codon:yes gene_type:complete
MGFFGPLRQCPEQQDIEQQQGNDDTKTEGKYDDQQGTDDRYHHQGKQGNGQAHDYGLLADISVDLVLFHLTPRFQ